MSSSHPPSTSNTTDTATTALPTVKANTLHPSSATTQLHKKMHYNPVTPSMLSTTTQYISHTHNTQALYKLLSHSIDKQNGFIREPCVINYRYQLHKVLIESLFGYVVIGTDSQNNNTAVCIKISNKSLCNKHQSVRGDNVVDNVKREAAMMYYLQTQPHSHHAQSSIHMLDETDVGSDSDDDREVLCDLSRLSTSSSTLSLADQQSSMQHNYASASCTPRLRSAHSSSNMKQLTQQVRKVYQFSRYLCKLVCEVEDNETHCLVSEYCDGSDLFDVILRNGPLDNNTAKHIFKQLCVSVKYMHARNIAHLDISLENICLTSSGEIRLIDFGSAAIHPLDVHAQQLAQYGYSIQPANNVGQPNSTSGELTQQNVAQLSSTQYFPCVPARRKPGKKAYMSPEIYSGRDGWLGNTNTSFDAYSVDIWSLGVILYTLLTGHPPFEKPDPNDDAWFRFIYTGRWLHAESRLKKNSGIYRDLDDDALQLINSILKPQHQRPTIDDILNNAWLNGANNLTDEQIAKGNKQAARLAIVQPISQQTSHA